MIIVINTSLPITLVIKDGISIKMHNCMALIFTKSIYKRYSLNTCQMLKSKLNLNMNSHSKE